MAPELHNVVNAVQSWLMSSHHIQVPFAWLEACVQWLQQEERGAAGLSQQHINQQVLDQWLLTDLRDLDYPVLPEGLSQAQKTELSGSFCVQVDSLLDVSQPAYSQLLKSRGTDCSNDEVSALTLTNQSPWEAKPTRMLLLQLSDGVQSLEAMEYQSTPSLSDLLRPGAKLLLQGRMVCRLGMLLLGPSNVTVLGGEVEDLVDRNNQKRMLSRTLGLPEEQQQEEEGGGATAASVQGDWAEEAALEGEELDDIELLSSVEVLQEVQVLSAADSGYRTLQEGSSSESSASTLSSRRDISISSLRPSSRGDGFQAVVPPALITQVQSHIEEEDLPDDEDFADIPLEELDSEIFEADSAESSSRRSSPPHVLSHAVMDMDCEPDVEEVSAQPNPEGPGGSSGLRSKQAPPTSPPFTYLCLIDRLMVQSPGQSIQVKVKAFIVTLSGKLSSSNGAWSVGGTISDGTSYLDVLLSNHLLTHLLGFTVTQKAALKRDPARRAELEAGMRRCQEELVDMCCVMTIHLQPHGRKAVVTSAEPVSEKMVHELQERRRR
ncbi:recQ-mediated genome instability protein 1 isoform X2 [Gouania willdenowi]|uniref:RecQ-mediated genome instability protein 1 n=2 Tax=Gouania willdenowi TaxID=441366 RepID=A0A8C5G932_GOUWI|nr:recQ-mediated genome instability protein 1 isoform X2 [Gouania willdenowi]